MITAARTRKLATAFEEPEARDERPDTFGRLDLRGSRCSFRRCKFLRSHWDDAGLVIEVFKNRGRRVVDDMRDFLRERSFEAPARRRPSDRLPRVGIGELLYGVVESAELMGCPELLDVLAEGVRHDWDFPVAEPETNGSNLRPVLDQKQARHRERLLSDLWLVTGVYHGELSWQELRDTYNRMFAT